MFNVIAKTTPSVTGGLFDFERVSVAEDSLLISPATIITEYLRQEGLVSDPDDDLDWPLFISKFPDIKTEQGAAYDTTGIKKGREMDGKVIQDYGVQIKIGSDDSNTAFEKAEEIALELDTVLDVLLAVDGEDYIIHDVSRTGPPIYIGLEGKRKLFTVNFLVTLCRC